MSDPVGDIVGDYRAFAAQQRDRLLARDIDIRPYPLSQHEPCYVLFEDFTTSRSSVAPCMTWSSSGTAPRSTASSTSRAGFRSAS